MSNFEYVARDERMPVKKFVIYSLNNVQTMVKGNYSFKYKFIGNELRSMITRDISSGIGYEYEIEIAVNDPDDYYTPKGIVSIFRKGLASFNPQYDIDFCNDSEYIIQASIRNKRLDNLLLQLNIIFTRELNGDNYIVKYDKDKETLYWEQLSNETSEVDLKEKWCKELNYWNEVRDLYLIEKNKEENKGLKSRDIFKNALDVICEEKGYNV